VIGSGEKSEDALPCQRCQHGALKGLSNQVSLFVHQDEEEGFVLDDRTAEAASKLIPVLVVLGDAIEIVKPIAGVERRVSICPKHAAAELVGSRAGHHLHLSGTAP